MIQYSQRPSLFFTFILGAPIFTLAQSTSQQDDDSIDSSTMAILVLVVLSALLFLGSFSLWIQNCCDSAIPYNRSLTFRSVVLVGGSRARQTRHDRDSPGGVDKELIDSFPTIMYSAMKDMKIGVGSLECAVCLSEFSGEEVLRLLPSCDHAFHPHCISTWLANHDTCPVCRAKVVNNSRIPIKMEAIAPIATAIQMDDSSRSKPRSGEQNSASVSEGNRYCERFTLKAGFKLTLKRSASCEYMPGEGSDSRWIGRSERWSSSVVPWDCLSVKDNGRGDGLGILPV